MRLLPSLLCIATVAAGGPFGVACGRTTGAQLLHDGGGPAQHDAGVSGSGDCVDAAAAECGPRCSPGVRRCLGIDVVECDARGRAFEVIESCDGAGQLCREGACADACAPEQGDAISHLGCSFVLTDLDNTTIDSGSRAAPLPIAIAVSNTQPRTAEVEVLARGDAGLEPVAAVAVAPGGAELVPLPPRQIDGASAPDRNDGTHTALTASAFVVQASLPVGVVMFNPIGGGAFSADASLVMPTGALGSSYSVLGPAQTIADAQNPELDFDPERDDEDMRAALTIVALESTEVEITLGDRVAGHLAFGGPIDQQAVRVGPLELELAPHDVLNLESAGYRASFTGSRVEASAPVAVFTGAEAADVPPAQIVSHRGCCADHLETQLIADGQLGRRYVIAHSPSRMAALNASFVEGYPMTPPGEELDFIHVLAPEGARLQTTLDAPMDEIELGAGEDAVIEAPRDFVIEASAPIAVQQALASQGVIGLPQELPGGDPALFTPAAADQGVTDMVVVAPEGLPFAFVMVSAPSDAAVTLDGGDAREACQVQPVQGAAEWEVYRCQLSFPSVDPDARLITHDAGHREVHRIQADQRVAAWVMGWGRFSGYAYAAGKRVPRP